MQQKRPIKVLSSTPVARGKARQSFETALVYALMDRHSVSPRERHEVLQRVLGLTYQQARRRTAGAVGWGLDELRHVAEHYGESLGELFSAADPANAGLSASLAFESQRVPCSIWLGAGPRAVGRIGPLAAVQDDAGHWLVKPLSAVGSTSSFEVERLLVKANTRPPYRVAVLDDDVDHADSLAQFLGHSGLAARAFFSFTTLAEAIAAEPFDGYVLDWLIGHDDAEATIRAIRSQNEACPIVILTGQIERGNVKEAEITRVCYAYRVQNLDKPARLSSVLSLLQAGFAATVTPA